MTHATPTKLRSGEWGARTTAPVTAGETITVTTRAGKTWQARVEKVIWTNGEVAIVATRGDAIRNGTASTVRRCRCEMGGDLMSLGYADRFGERVTCPGCGGWTEVC